MDLLVFGWILLSSAGFPRFCSPSTDFYIKKNLEIVFESKKKVNSQKALAESMLPVQKL